MALYLDLLCVTLFPFIKHVNTDSAVIVDTTPSLCIYKKAKSKLSLLSDSYDNTPQYDNLSLTIWSSNGPYATMPLSIAVLQEYC